MLLYLLLSSPLMKGRSRLYWFLSLVTITMLCTVSKSQFISIHSSFSNKICKTSIKGKFSSQAEGNIDSAEKDKTSTTRHKRGLHAKVFAFFRIPATQIIYKVFVKHFFQNSEDIVCNSAVPFFLRGPPHTSF